MVNWSIQAGFGVTKCVFIDVVPFPTRFWGLIVYIYDAQLVHSDRVWWPKSGSGNVVIVRMGVPGGYLVTLPLSLTLSLTFGKVPIKLKSCRSPLLLFEEVAVLIVGECYRGDGRIWREKVF